MNLKLDCINKKIQSILFAAMMPFVVHPCALVNATFTIISCQLENSVRSSVIRIWVF